MKKVNITPVKKSEIDWVNARYQEIGFVESDYDKEHIVIAKVEGQRAGLGRLVQIDDDNLELGGIYTFAGFRGMGVADHIVRSLCQDNPFGAAVIWCLPFENLLRFYARFGFKKHQSGAIPEAVKTKLDWCNAEGRYEQEVVLLCNK